MGFGYIVCQKGFAFPTDIEFSAGSAIIEMAVMVIFYIVLYFYLDQVMPNEYGISKHPFFCLKRKNDKINESKFLGS